MSAVIIGTNVEKYVDQSLFNEVRVIDTTDPGWFDEWYLQEGDTVHLDISLLEYLKDLLHIDDTYEIKGYIVEEPTI